MTKRMALPSLKLMFAWYSFDIPDPTTTIPLVFSCIASTIPTSDSGAPIHLRVAIAIFWEQCQRIVHIGEGPVYWTVC